MFHNMHNDSKGLIRILKTEKDFGRDDQGAYCVSIWTRQDSRVFYLRLKEI